MNQRLLELRKALGLIQAQFGAKINLSQNSIAALEKGVRPLTDRVVADICREYNVNEQWLREGIGSMFRPKKTDESALAEQAAKLIKSRDPYTIKAVTFLLELINNNDPAKETFKQYVRDCAKILAAEEFKQQEEQNK
ncbi:MAG: helix-turn-helix transcriptional regulator [Phascolarctobacterium sp.]|nr:helix-turn-helix transcriptional regulator [Phascolarctobacterium sp.]